MLFHTCTVAMICIPNYFLVIVALQCSTANFNIYFHLVHLMLTVFLGFCPYVFDLLLAYDQLQCKKIRITLRSKFDLPETNKNYMTVLFEIGLTKL